MVVMVVVDMEPVPAVAPPRNWALLGLLPCLWSDIPARPGRYSFIDTPSFTDPRTRAGKGAVRIIPEAGG